MTGPPTGPPLDTFSPRHQQIIGGICCGASYKEIGLELHISEHTVRAHVVGIASKIPHLTELPPRWRILTHFKHAEWDQTRKTA